MLSERESLFRHFLSPDHATHPPPTPGRLPLSASHSTRLASGVAQPPLAAVIPLLKSSSSGQSRRLRQVGAPPLRSHSPQTFTSPKCDQMVVPGYLSTSSIGLCLFYPYILPRTQLAPK